MDLAGEKWALSVAFTEVIRSKVFMQGAARQHVPDGDQYRVLHYDDGPLGAAPYLVTEVQGAAIAAASPSGGPGDL